MSLAERYCVAPGEKMDLAGIPTDDDGGLSKDRAEGDFKRLKKRLADLQELLYADGRYALLVVFQAMDTGGKDSAIRAVFRGVNPQGCRVTSFKAPNDVERRHDFLWRIHEHTPRLGQIAIFNRSHYEDVLIVRVKRLVPERRWKRRYDHINHFEEMLNDEGVRIVKFYLHISKDYQKKRLVRRLETPNKHWKFDPGDLAERQRWDEYIAAYEAALQRCSTPHAPWYVVPAEKRWFRNLLMARILVDTLEGLDLRYPEPTFDPAKIVIL